MMELVQLLEGHWAVGAFVVLGSLIGALNWHVSTDSDVGLFPLVVATCSSIAYPLLGLLILFANRAQ